MSLATACWLLPRFRWHRLARIGLAIVATAALWLAAIDYVTYRNGCIHCWSHTIHGDLRIFHQPIWSWQDPDHLPEFRLIAEDLGAPCPHEYERWERLRMWGLIYPGTSRMGICCLTDGDWYEGSIRDRVRAMGEKDRGLAAR